MAEDSELSALQELERRQLAGDKTITPEIGSKVRAKLDAYRRQGLAKPLVSSEPEGKPLPAWAATPYEQQVGVYSGIRRGVNTFKDEYAGNTVTGGLENTLQAKLGDKNSGILGVGDPGQRDWWAQFGSADNVIRNDLFGAALTESEKAAYAATTVNPSMESKEVRKNLESRRDILTAALKRRTAFLKAQGYSQDAIEALAGEFAQDLGAAVVAPTTPPAPGAPPPADDTAKPVSVEQAVDIATGVNKTARVDIRGARTPLPLADEQKRQQYLSKLDALPDGEERRALQAEFVDWYAQAAPEAVAAPDAPLATERGRNGIMENVDAVVRGVADTATLGFADELSAVGDTVFKGGTYEENLSRERGVDRYDERNNPYMRLGGQIAGGVTPIGVGRVGMGATTPRGMAAAGGVLGAGYGFGSGETLGDRFIRAGTGGVAGAGAGLVLGRLSDRFINRGGGGGAPPAPPPAPDTLNDVAGRLNITPTPATIGGRTAEGAQIGLGNAPGSMGPVRNAVEAETQALSDAARRTAGQMGPVTTPQQAGDILARGARVSDRAAARRAGRQYDARTEMMGGDHAPVTMGGTTREIANIANDFGSNEVVSDMLTHPLVRRMSDAEANELTLSESTELLSEARRVSRNARASKQPGRLINQLSSLESAIEGDVMRAAQASDRIAGRAPGEGAEAAQREGDRLWTDRMRGRERELKKPLASFDDNVNVSNESTYRQLFGDMREEGGNLVRLRRTLDRMPERARSTFAATAFDDFGKAVPSQQNATNDAWSFETFMTNWGKASPEAKRLVFEGRGADREISDIVRYSDRLRQLNRARNFSNTAATGANASYVTALVGSLFAGGPGAATAVGAVYPAMNIAGRAFVSTPAARQWLRTALHAAVRGNDSQVRTLVRRLPSLAARNPQISAEIGQFEQAILKAANDNVGSAGSVAASVDERPNKK